MPKRDRTPSNSSSNGNSDGEGASGDVLDESKFVVLSAQRYYWDVLVNKSFVLERGFKPDARDGNIVGQIRQRGWNLLVETPCPAPVAIIREFYANARETQNGISYVRGRHVSYTPQAINDIYRLPTPSPDNTNWVLNDRFKTDLDELVNEMCKPETSWKTKAGTTKKIHFPQTALNRYAKAWYSFICANILPTTHHQEVTTERAVLLYAILKDQRFDLGLLLNQSMLRFMRASTSGGIPHAALVTRLCLAAQVVWDDEILQMPMRDIDSATISKYTIWGGGQSDQSGLGFIMADSDDDDEEEEESSQMPAQIPPTAYLARQDREMRRLHRRMDTMHTDFKTYTTEFSAALSQAFSQMGVETQFPTFGSSSSYPPPDTPPEQDEGGGDDPN